MYAGGSSSRRHRVRLAQFTPGATRRCTPAPLGAPTPPSGAHLRITQPRRCLLRALASVGNGLGMGYRGVYPPESRRQNPRRSFSGAGAAVSFYRMTWRRMANAKSAICKGPNIPSAVTKNWNQDGPSGCGSGRSRARAPKL